MYFAAIRDQYIPELTHPPAFNRLFAIMEGRYLRLLYLGSQFPPGWAGRAVFLHQYCGEVFLWQKLSEMAHVSTVGLLNARYFKLGFEAPDDAPGLKHELILWDGHHPAAWNRWLALGKLRHYYEGQVSRGEMPDAIVVCNLHHHVFNYFVKWLRRQPKRPLLILQICDTCGLGLKVPLLRRLRYKFKLMKMLESDAASMYEDGCILSSVTSKKYFEPRGIPWVWHPATYKFHYEPPAHAPDQKGPIRFGFFGYLSTGNAVDGTAEAFLRANVAGTLHIAGHGELAGYLAKLAERRPDVRFDGFLPKESDCLDWAQQVDVLINPRLPIAGQDNSFPSKVLEYGIAGKAIMSTHTGGTDAALGKEGIYFDAENFVESLQSKIRDVSAMDRTELQRRGQIIRSRFVTEFSAEEQARRIVEFVSLLVRKRNETGLPG